MSPATDAPLLKVGASSDPKKVAAAIHGSVFDLGAYPSLRAIGHGAVGQAVKAIAVARGSCGRQGVNLATQVSFFTIKGDSGDELSAMVFTLFDRG